MSKRLVILLASLAANVLLAAVLVYSHTTGPQRDGGSAASAANSQPPSSASRSHNDRDDAVASTNRGEAAAANSAFHWSQLESQDYKAYIAKLRAFGVPERTIRDIIMADIQKLYRPRFAALRPPKKAANTNFWQNRFGYNPYGSATKEQRAQSNALQKEQTELIKELLGKDVYLEVAKDSQYPDWTERMFGPIPQEQRDKVTEMQERFQEATSEIYAKADGFVDQDTQRDLKVLRRKFRDELATVLTPEQIEEYEMRSSDTANQMRWQLGTFEPNEQEFRAIFKYKQTLEDLDATRNSDEDNPRPSTAEERMASMQKRKGLDDALTQALGADRLKEYKLMDQWEYRNLLESGVAKESVFKVADMKTQVEDAARKVRQDKSLSNEQRNEALKAIRTETEITLTDLLGARRAKAYSNSGGWWLRNLAPRP